MSIFLLQPRAYADCRLKAVNVSPMPAAAAQEMHGDTERDVTRVPPDDPVSSRLAGPIGPPAEHSPAAAPMPTPDAVTNDAATVAHSEGSDPANAEQGLTDELVVQLRERFGANEVKTKQMPEWKKIVRRFSDWICLLIVRPLPSHLPEIAFTAPRALQVEE